MSRVKIMNNKIENLSSTDAQVILIELYEKNKTQDFTLLTDAELNEIKCSLNEFIGDVDTDVDTSKEEIAKYAIKLCQNDDELNRSIKELLIEPPIKRCMGSTTLLLASVIFVLQGKINFERDKDGGYLFSFKKEATDTELIIKLITSVLNKFPNIPSFFKK